MVERGASVQNYKWTIKRRRNMDFALKVCSINNTATRKLATLVFSNLVKTCKKNGKAQYANEYNASR